MWSRREKLPTLASHGDELTTKTLGMAGRKESCDETQNGGKTDDVRGKLGHQEPKDVANIMDNHNTHGWIIAASSVRCRGCLARPYMNAWKAASLSIDSCGKEAWKPRACGRRWQPRFWPMWRKNGGRKETEVLWMLKEKEEESTNLQFHVGRQLLDHIPLKKAPGAIIKRPYKLDLEPKPATWWWTSTHAAEEEEEMMLGTSKGCHEFPFEDEFRILGCMMNRQGKM